jgi:hypothetical protein
MARKFFVGGNFKMCVARARFGVTPPWLLAKTPRWSSEN